MRLSIISLILCASFSAFSQIAKQKKQLKATRTAIAPKIDGNLNDDVWSIAPIATNFIEIRPVPGRVEPQSRKTEVKFLYDDFAIYVYARMTDKRDSIVHELVNRDNIGNADFVGIVFDTFLDGVNGYGFFVTSAGVQFDAKYSLIGGEDPNWNAVWESHVSIDETGWSAEMKIPYSALRFSGKPIQNWGMNITRKRTGSNLQTFWNYVDPKVDGFINQSGVLEGLENIKPPLRLSFSPYLSTLINHYPYNTPGVNNTKNTFNGGMDVKYGINKSFTLDMTLIPDFGQVISDNRVLNLTPFEIKFNENRQFFTEGTELFNKGDLFYSRRIGASPSYFNYDGVNPNETIVKDPQEAKILNATKISGRTGKGLGIGIFNAITNTMRAEVEDQDGNKRHVETQPLTNYNIIVFDQTFKNNSSVSFINTNVLRQGSAYDANVSAALFNFNDKNNKYYIEGAGKLSYITADPIVNNRNGYSYTAELGKKSGSFLFNYSQELLDTKFDPSDMGFYTNNNFFDQNLNFSYQIFKPGKWYNQIQSWTEITYSRRFNPGDYQNFVINPGIYTQFKNFWSVEVFGVWKAEGNDFYEARNGQVFKTPENYRLALFVNPNRTKAYNFGGNIQFYKRKLYNGKGYNFYFFQNLRVNDKLSFGVDLAYSPNFDYVNWVSSQSGNSIFSRYDRQTVENSIDAKYNFTNRMGLNFRVRHYWSDRRNKEFFLLNSVGRLDPYNGASIQGADRNYNVFNIDLMYQWVFAPGSELNITYKDAAETNDRFFTKKYGQNLDRILTGPQNNSLSVKVLYFIDYLDLKKKKPTISGS